MAENYSSKELRHLEETHQIQFRFIQLGWNTSIEILTIQKNEKQNRIKLRNNRREEPRAAGQRHDVHLKIALLMKQKWIGPA
jgi:hypothetical protein